MPHLYELASQVPFDDRVCHQGEIGDLNLSLIKEFLRQIKSDLYKQAGNFSFEQLCRQMQIVQGPDEYLKPLNIGILMFNEDPDRFFPCARIEVVEFHDEVGDSFSEKIFKGPIHLQLREALRYIQTMYIREEVRKRPDRAEADRFYNYPFIALEESLANAVYHKDYAKREPIEIRIHPNRIEIISFPGPLPPLKLEDLNRGVVKIRNYRNRRIGDFLKELHLTEGRCTGLPKIRRAMENNGSSPAIFETDQEASYFLTILPIHPDLQIKTDQLGIETDQLGIETDQLGVETDQLGVETDQLGVETDQLGIETDQLGVETDQLGVETDQLGVEVEQITGVHNSKVKLPAKLQNKLACFPKRPQKSETWEMIYQLCSWKALSAQELAIILNKKSKKYLVNAHLTPMIKQKKLGYTYPGGVNAPQQAYKAL